MKLRSSIKANLLASWAAHGVALAVGLFLMPYVLHTLGDGSYGTWIFINAFSNYAGLLYLGFGKTVSRFVASYHARHEWDRLNEVVNVALAVYSLMGLLTLVAVGVLAWLAPALHAWEVDSVLEIQWVIVVLGVNVVIGLVGSVFGGVLYGVQRFDQERTILIGADLLRAALTVLFLQSRWGLLTLSLIFLVVTVLENLAHIALALRNVPTLAFGVRYLKLHTLKECLGFSVFALVGTLAGQLIYATDTVVIGFVLGARAIVPYYIALRLCQFLRRPIQQIGDVCMPKAGELQARSQGDQLQSLVVRSMGVAVLLAAGVLIGAVCFGDALIERWVGPGYPESHLLLMAMLAGQVVAIPIDVLRSIMFGMGHVRGPSLAYLGEALANIVLSLILIHPLGLWGVALGTIIPLVLVELGWLLPFALRKLQFHPLVVARGVLGPQILPLVALLCYSTWVDSQFDVSGSWVRLGAVTVGGGAVLGGTWGLQWLLQRSGRVPRAAAAA